MSCVARFEMGGEWRNLGLVEFALGQDALSMTSSVCVFGWCAWVRGAVGCCVIVDVYGSFDCFRWSVFNAREAKTASLSLVASAIIFRFVVLAARSRENH